MGEPMVINVSAGPINGGRKTAPYFACLLFPPRCSRSASRYCLVLIPTAARKMLLAPCASRSARNFACASRQTQRKGLLLVPQAIRSARRFAVPSSPPQCKGFLLALQSGQSPRRFAFPLNPTAVQGVLLAAQPNRSARRFACALPSHAARHSRLHLCKEPQRNGLRWRLVLTAAQTLFRAPQRSRSARRFCVSLTPTAMKGMPLAPCTSRSAGDFARAATKRCAQQFAGFPSQPRRRDLRCRLEPTAVQGLVPALQSAQSSRRFAFPFNSTVVQRISLAAQPNCSVGRFARAPPNHGSTHSRLRLCPAAAQ